MRILNKNILDDVWTFINEIKLLVIVPGEGRPVFELLLDHNLRLPSAKSSLEVDCFEVSEGCEEELLFLGTSIVIISSQLSLSLSMTFKSISVFMFCWFTSKFSLIALSLLPDILVLRYSWVSFSIFLISAMVRLTHSSCHVQACLCALTIVFLRAAIEPIKPNEWSIGPIRVKIEQKAHLNREWIFRFWFAFPNI